MVCSDISWLLLIRVDKKEGNCWFVLLDFEKIDVFCLVMNEYQTAYEGKIFQLKLFCGKEYPESPPTVRFQTRINMACVNPETGVVEPSLFPMLTNWRREYTMEDILVKLKKEMMTSHNRKLAQPPEGNFSSLQNPNSVYNYCHGLVGMTW